MTLKLNTKTFFMVPETTLINKEWTFDWMANIEAQKIALSEKKIMMIFEKIGKMDIIETQKNNPTAEKIVAAILNFPETEQYLELITKETLTLYKQWQKNGIKEQYFIFSKAFNLDLDFFMTGDDIQINTMGDFIKKSFDALSTQYSNKKTLSLQIPLYDRPVGGISKLSNSVEEGFWGFVQTEIEKSKKMSLKI